MKLFLLASLVGNKLINALYEGQKVVRCYFNETEEVLPCSGLDIWSRDYVKRSITFRFMNKEQEKCFDKDKCETIIEYLSIQESFQNTRTKREVVVEDFFGKYRNYLEMKTKLQEWANQSSCATYNNSIGKSYEERDIFAFKITSNSTQKKQGIWINGGLHAREWIAPAAVLYTIDKLLKNAETPNIKQLLDRFEFHFTPLANPDGYEFSLTEDRYFRKNRRINYDGTVGVDLNRNWNDHWGMIGASNITSEEDYQGSFPHSEPEVQVLADYVLSMPNRYASLDVHSYGQYILRNWGYSKQKSYNEDLLKPLGRAMQLAFGKHRLPYRNIVGGRFYEAGGALDDWLASQAKLISFTIELSPHDGNPRIGFHPSAFTIRYISESFYDAVIAFANYLLIHPQIPPNIPTY